MIQLVGRERREKTRGSRSRSRSRSRLAPRLDAYTMSNAKNQHWLPQLYLRAFRVPEAGDAIPRLWTFFRNGPEEPRLMSVEEVAAQRYLYSPGENATSRDHSADVRLQQLESMLGPLWPHLIEGFPPLDNEAVRKALALFVATLYSRHPRRIGDIRAIHQQIVQALDKLPKDENGNPAISHVEVNGYNREFDSSNWLPYTRAGKMHFQKSFVGNIVSNSGSIAEILLLKRWAVIVSDEPVFATCDAPIVLANAKKTRFGFGTKGTSLYLPLSPKRFLIIEDPGLPDGYYSSKPGFPEAMNYQTWCAADRYLLSGKPSDEILKGVMWFADEHGLS